MVFCCNLVFFKDKYKKGFIQESHSNDYESFVNDYITSKNLYYVKKVVSVIEYDVAEFTKKIRAIRDKPNR